MSTPDRAAREAAALRANLLKRKQQSRLRQAAPDAEVKPSADGDGLDGKSGAGRSGDKEQPG
jgi:hypothetical protein